MLRAENDIYLLLNPLTLISFFKLGCNDLLLYLYPTNVFVYAYVQIMRFISDLPINGMN